MKKSKISLLKFNKKVISKLNSEKIIGAKKPPTDTWTSCPWGDETCG